MNIGFVTIYPWRPHGFHTAYLEYQSNLLGYSNYFLECGGTLDKCFTKLNGTGGVFPCAKCQLGKASKYSNSKVFTISSKISNDRLNQNEIIKSLSSSAISIYREEVNLDCFSNPILAQSLDRLKNNYLKTYYSTLDLIDKKNLQCLVVFNGRIDMTRAAIDAAKFAKINFITHDRPIWAHGIHIGVNENVVGLKGRFAINAKFDDKPLTNYQAKLAGNEIAKRFLSKNFLEWRVYNLGAKKLSQWPTKNNDKKILILPSSIFEVAGHEDRATPWNSGTDGFDLFLKSIGAKKNQVVVRFHPHWSEKRGKSRGQSSINHYKTWCKNNSYHYIDSNEKVSTIDLIDKCDLLLLNGSTAAIEGGSLGKKIVNLGSCNFSGAGFCKILETEDSIARFNGFDNWMSKEEIIQKTLRYVYTELARFPQYFEYVRAITTTECVAYKGANPERLENIIKYGILKEDDDSIGSLEEESEIINLIINKSWNRLIELYSTIEIKSKIQLNISRSFPYGIVDNLRKHFKRGDL